MSPADYLPHLAIGAAAVTFGILSGRARASRLRNLQADLAAGNTRGYLVLLTVVLLIAATLIRRA